MPAQPYVSEEKQLARLRAGDESAFTDLVDGLNCRLQALAATFTSSRPLVEDIVQETWLAVIRGLHAFEGRSSLNTWIFSILVRRARTIASRESKRADAAGRSEDLNGDAFVEWEPGRGRVGLWERAPVPWILDDPAAIYQSAEALEVVRAALEALPEMQRRVVLLRDVEDISAEDVCNILSLTDTNERVLLHRGRARVRRALDEYVREGFMPSNSRSTGAGAHVNGAPLTTSRAAKPTAQEHRIREGSGEL